MVLKCPKCGSTNILETTYIEACQDCNFAQHYHYWNHDEPNFEYSDEDEN